MFKIIYKEKGDSSFQAIKKWQIQNNIKKIGHTGTLDPLAQGLLLVATDDDTKLIPYLKSKDKEYIVEMKLGFTSETLDAEGPINFASDIIPTENQVIQVIEKFVGQIQQTPPIYSAKKINGVRAYKMARDNKISDVELKPILVNIYHITNIDYNYPFIKFKTKVSNGTYIRSLVRDIGEELKTGAYMTFLERTMVNGVASENQINHENLFSLPTLKISLEELKNLYQGIQKQINGTSGLNMLIFENTIVGILELDKNKIINQKLFGKRIQAILI